jgi:transposase
MKNSTARKLQQIPAGYLLMGVDPHKKKHVAVAMTQDAIVHAKLRFTNSKEGFEEMLERARAEMVRTGSRGVIFAIETASHYWRNLPTFWMSRAFPSA